MRKLRVAISIPVYGMCHAKFTQSLASLIVHSLGAELRDAAGEPMKLELETFMVSCSMLTESRHRLVAEALAWEADFMLCLDADHVFPPDTLVRLLAHGLPAVGANYPRRFAPTAPTAAILRDAGSPAFAPGSQSGAGGAGCSPANQDERAVLRSAGSPSSPATQDERAADAGSESVDESPGSLLYTTREKAEAGLVEPVAHLGFGVLLLDMRIFDALQAHAEAEAAWEGAPASANFLPLFKFEPTPDKVGMIGEDVFFFRKLAEAGIRPFVDHRLSWEVGHLFETVLTNGHALAQREAWDGHQRTKAAKFAAKAEAIEQREKEETADG